MTTIIPNELNITINTSVPGFQKIKYKPSMTIPNINKDDKTIQFDPLLKLNPAIIKKVPEDLRKKEFFNRGLFQSLLNYHHGSHKAKTLKEATFTGIVDNNIKVTLDTLFPTNSVIYINKNPYVIVDIQWRKGDWKLDTKMKPVNIDSSKIQNPYLYASVVHDEIISGERQLRELSPELTYGENYVGPQNTIKPATTTTSTTIDTIATTNTSSPSSVAIPVAIPVASGVSLPPTPNTNAITPTTITPTTTETPTTITSTTTETPTTEPYPVIKPYEEPDTRPLSLEDNPDKVNPNVEEVPSSDDRMVPETKLIPSKDSSKFMRDFFESASYYYIVNSLYKFMKVDSKSYINRLYLNTTTISVKTNTINISKDAYIETVKNLSVKNNPGRGDCFFIAVADAINYHNYIYNADKISSGIYGYGDKIFTQRYLRSLVSDYILSSPDLETYLQNAIVNTENLNTQFENHVKTTELLAGESGQHNEMGSLEYMETAIDIYRNNDNFLVKMPTKIPFEATDFYKPFQVLSNSEIKTYIESSDYWANEVGIYALCSKLGLNIIPIERVDKKQGSSTLRIPFANFSNSNDKWTKYLFLYYYSGHYELITFNYTRKTLAKLGSTPVAVKNISKIAVIYDRRNNYIIPPIYILVLIYGSYYSNQSNEYKKQFSFFPDLMETIENSYSNIIATNYNSDNKSLYKFKSLLNTTFPQKNNSNSTVISSVPQIENASQEGGQPPYNNPYNNPYNKPAYKMGKPGEKDDTNISYYVTIDMELHPGLTLTPTELKESQCRQKWNAVRKAYAGFTGQPYVIKPIYQPNKTAKNKEDHNKNNTRSQRGGIRKINKTSKHNLYTESSKRRKTLKNM